MHGAFSKTNILEVVDIGISPRADSSNKVAPDSHAMTTKPEGSGKEVWLKRYLRQQMDKFARQ